MAKKQYHAVSVHSMLKNSLTKDWACIIQRSIYIFVFLMYIIHKNLDGHCIDHISATCA